MARRVTRVFRSPREFRDWVRELHPAFAPDHWGYRRDVGGSVAVSYPLVVIRNSGENPAEPAP